MIINDDHFNVYDATQKEVLRVFGFSLKTHRFVLNLLKPDDCSEAHKPKIYISQCVNTNNINLTDTIIYLRYKKKKIFGAEIESSKRIHDLVEV